jgi:hypothetical protein
MLNPKRISQDEVHITCSRCDFFQAVPLTLDGKYDGKGITVIKGSCSNHALEANLRLGVPEWKKENH